MNRQYTAVSGIAIALIVLNHTVHFTLQISPVSGYWLRAAVFLQAFGVFAVPAFLFVSGAFLSYAARQMSFTFLRNSIGRIFWPYAIWTAVFFVLVLPAADALPSPAAYFRYILTGYPYHFVPLLLFWYLSSPIVITTMHPRNPQKPVIKPIEPTATA